MTIIVGTTIVNFGLLPLLLESTLFMNHDCSSQRIYLPQATLVDSLLEHEFVGIIRSEKLTGNDLHCNLGEELSSGDSSEIIDAALVHQLACLVQFLGWSNNIWMGLGICA
jgi:hypothetical protein